MSDVRAHDGGELTRERLREAVDDVVRWYGDDLQPNSGTDSQEALRLLLQAAGWLLAQKPTSDEEMDAAIDDYCNLQVPSRDAYEIGYRAAERRLLLPFADDADARDETEDEPR